METKICRICGIEKDILYFRKGKVCRQCENKKNKKWNKLNKEKMQEYMKKYYLENKETMKRKRHFWYKKWRENNIEHIKNYKKNKPLIEKKKDRIRKTIRVSFTKKGLCKSQHTEQIVGMPLEEFYYYLLQTYKDNYGTEWDGIEKVHIDHKKPLKYANTEEEVMLLCNYKNLQLLKAKDNLEKNAKLYYELKGE